MRLSGKIFAAAAALVAGLPLVAGCQQDESRSAQSRALVNTSTSMGEGVYALTIKGSALGRDNDVHCVYVDSYKAGDLSCDWGVAAASSLSLTADTVITRVAPKPEKSLTVINIEGTVFGRDRNVICIYASSYKAGGLNCEW